MADVDLVVSPHQGKDGAWTRCSSLESAKPLYEGCILGPTGRIDFDQDALAPVSFDSGKESLEFLADDSPRVLLHRWIGAVQHQAGGSLRVGRGKHQTHLAAFGPAIYDSAFRAGRIHNCPHVADPFFQSHFRGSIRKSLAALVENDYTGKRGEPSQQILVGRQFPVELYMREGSRHQHDVERAVAEDPIRDVNVATLGVFDGRLHKHRYTSAHR